MKRTPYRRMKLGSKIISLVLIFGLVFSMNTFAFAETVPTPAANEPAATDVTDTTEDAITDVDVPADNPDADFPLKDVDKKSKDADKSVKASTSNAIRINNVEVLTRPDVQSLYRDTVYKGKAANGEDPDKYYTTYREFNLKDPRVFELEFDVPSTLVGGDAAAFRDSITLSYGGVSIDDWKSGNLLKTGDSIFSVEDRDISDNTDGTHTVRILLKQDTPWYTASQSDTGNIPFDGYIGGDQRMFNPTGTGRNQSGDNRPFWQAGPVNRGFDEYELLAVADKKPLAATDIHIAAYDEMHSWVEMNEWAQSLIKAIKGQELAIEELDERPTGIVASGYVGMDSDGNFVQGNATNNVYVDVAIIGYGLTDNYKDENKDFNNYSRFNPMWNITVATDKNKINKYLTETVPLMNDDPQKLIDKYKDAAAEDIDMVNVYYQNNVHADEVSGTDSEIKLVNDLIEGGQAGKKIKYKTFSDDDMNYRYRVPTAGYEQNGSSHIVKGGYATGSTFMKNDTREEAIFDTKEALEELIFVSTLTNNPDGKAGMRRVNRYAIDNNRDAVFSTQPECIAMTKDIMKWDPLLMNEWHGYVAQMLIEPCTAPHDPTYDYDLMQNNMLQLSYSAGKAVTANTGYANFRVPWDHLSNGGWDDGGTIYTPMLSMLLGTYGYTIEFPHANSDSFVAGNVINYAMLNEIMTGKTAFYEGNALNGPLEDTDGEMRDSHQVDNKYTDMRKSTVMNKLETKLRGVKNIDSMAADKYFIDVIGGKEVVVGRARPTDKDGKELSYFPDYIVIPADDANQYNIAEGIKGINWMMQLGIKVKKTTEDVVYDGKKIEKGAYVFDMKQGRRNVIFEMLSKGYDATKFASMYADIYCNFPDVRGYDSIQIYSDGLFDGKATEMTEKITKVANIDGTADDYVVFKSQSTDAVRFVNLLLSGRSSGPSYAEKGDVWMLRKAVDGVGSASDYVIKAKDLNKINNLVDNPDLGLLGCHIEGKYIAELPEEATKLVEPVIQFNLTRTAQTGGPLWWALDEYLGFASMADTTGYNGSRDSMRPDANVVVSSNANPHSSIINAVKEQKLGLVLIQSAAALNDANFGTGSSAPTATGFRDVALNGTYNVDDSLYTANYAKSSTIFAWGNGYATPPAGSKVLFKTLPDGNDAFIGGFQATSGVKTSFGNKATIFSTILDGGGIEGKPVQSLTIGQYMANRSHYQKLYPILATGIFAGAAGIIDDQNDPEVNDITVSGNKFTFTAQEPNTGVKESGIESLAISKWNGNKYVEVFDQNTDKAVLDIDATADQRFMITATDYAGNVGVKNAIYTAETKTFEYYDAEKTAINIANEDGTKDLYKLATIGSEIGDLPDPGTKDGFNFKGWYLDDEFNKAAKEDTKVVEGITLYAKWIEVVEDLQEYLDEIDAYVDANDYRKAEQNELADLIADAKNSAKHAEDSDELKAIVAEFKDRVDELKTADRLGQEEWANEVLAHYKDPGKYFETEQTYIKNLLADAEAAIDKAADEKAIEAIVDEYKAKLDDVKTIDDYGDTRTDAEKLADAKDDAMNALTFYTNLDDYRAEEVLQVAGYVLAGQIDISKATTQAQIDAIIAKYQALINGVLTDADWQKIEAQMFKVNATAGAGGTITPSGEHKYGTDAEYAYKPNTGYYVSKLTVNGESVAFTKTGGSYKFKTIKEHHNIKVDFAKQTFKVTTSKKGKGKITKSKTVAYGSKVVIKVKPKKGYRIAKVTIDGKKVKAKKKYTITVTKAKKVKAVFKKKKKA